MIQFAVGALFGPVGLVVAVAVTIIGVGVGLDSTIWDDDGGDDSAVPDDDGTTITHYFRYWDDQIGTISAGDFTSSSSDLIRSDFMKYYETYGSSRFVSLNDHLNHVPKGMDGWPREFFVSLWVSTWGTWDEADSDDYLIDDGYVNVPRIDEDDDEDIRIVLPGLVPFPEENANEDDVKVVYRTDPTVRYVNDYIYEYMNLYKYTYPDVDFDWFETDGDFTVTCYQDDYFDWGIYFLILFPVLAVEIAIFNRFRSGVCS